MKQGHWQWLKRLPALLEIPSPDRAQLLDRVQMMERDLVLPAKAIIILILIWSFYLSPWMGSVLGAMEVAVELTQYFFVIYILANVVAALLFFNLRRLPLTLARWTVFANCLVDGLLLAAITVVTLDFASILYWLLFLILIVRNAVSVLPGTSQLLVNFGTGLCYLLAYVSEDYVFKNLDNRTQQALEQVGHAELSTEVLVLRLALLWLMALCCYGVQMLLDRQRLASEEAREFAVREGQLRSAGRLAAEFAHQIKNPLAIINNAAFSLHRALKDAKPETLKPVEIIQEEVAHADQIITQIMGYAQLSEGRVEKLDVVEELDRALEQVFPAAVLVGIRVHRQYASSFPPLLMQRRHLSETLVNVLQNAREALDGRGNVQVTAACLSDYSVEITVQDDGPGVASDKTEKIFEAYYTTKPRGTGLGLAMVKHNVELYGGTVRVESGLGNGAKFVLLFPAKTLLKFG
ncbi:MAG: ATP-binding protein [Verrucomicrobia bacterium]|nr:ATP-binding protein [Verrucomicrobiota bacterium]